ncbi:hypothetical protein Tco_1292042 [Tanacetum coccineum]
MQAAQDRQKSYADRKAKSDGELSKMDDRVMLKSHHERSRTVRLELPQELSRVHHTFHVSNLKKCYADEPVVMPLEGIHVDDKLQFVEEPVEIMEREIKRLKRSRIPLVKVRWNSRRGPEFTWEREDSFKQKYPQLLTNRASSSTTRIINPQETQQVVARDEKWVPSTERVKISSTNVRLETTVPQKEETFQVIIDIIKNSTCFKAFTNSTDVLEIFMQQIWYTIKKVKDSKSYEFLLANKKCIVDAEVFRKILDIFPRVEGEVFTPVQDDDDTLTFLTNLGYKGPLHKHTNIVDKI